MPFIIAVIVVAVNNAINNNGIETRNPYLFINNENFEKNNGNILNKYKPEKINPTEKFLSDLKSLGCGTKTSVTNTVSIVIERNSIFNKYTLAKSFA